MFQPVYRLAIELLLNGDVGHRRRCRRPMPVLFAWREPDDVTGPNLLDRLTTTFRPDHNLPPNSSNDRRRSSFTSLSAHFSREFLAPSDTPQPPPSPRWAGRQLPGERGTPKSQTLP